jgi:anhydro-N-acetylmuramic acid kinase
LRPERVTCQFPALLAWQSAGGTGFEVADFSKAIGLMSGTSLDGVDVAVLTTDGERIDQLGPARTYPYSEEDRRLLRAATAEAAGLTDRRDRPEALAEAEALTTTRHAEAVETFLDDAGLRASDIGIVGFHGQTMFHDPAKALTIQIGDGQRLADRLGISVAWDFRAADMAAGGQGAPLAPVFHRALAETAGLERPVAFLNLGGVANITYVGEDELIAFDTGPGNGLLDDWMLSRRGEAFDRDGRLAASGVVDTEVLGLLLAHPYFEMPPPKSLDRNAFPTQTLAALSDIDGAATLLAFTVQSIVRSAALLPRQPRGWYASGGGAHNVEMMRRIGEAFEGKPVAALGTLGFDGDATEAQAFAFLAVRTMRNLPLSYPTTTGVPRPMRGGVLSRPQR